MKRKIFARIVLCLWTLTFIGPTVDAATKPNGNARMPGSISKSGTTEPCLSCHVCDTPTAEDRCLRTCVRKSEELNAQTSSEKRGPDLVLLDELVDHYLPVPFDHAGHAEMAKMTRGCVVCHHFTPVGEEHPACSTCHEVNPQKQSMRKPGLKGAYHRQCLSCHREWSHKTQCDICHQSRTSRDFTGTQVALPTPDDIMGQMHPPIPEPDTEIYQTRSTSAPGSKVIFRHKEHIHRFGLRCAECHHEDNCSRCHELGNNHKQRTKTLAQHHQPCASCHDVHKPTLCARCHWEEGQLVPPQFDHAVTGWPLHEYHKNLSCRLCHPVVPFVNPDRECNTCHENWSSENFDHNITGQKLDENHSSHDCEECHVDRSFERPPTCDECHDEEEGIVFPAKRPGPKN